MKIIITGGRGFIGSHLVDYAVSQGHDVLAVDNESADPVAPKNKKARYFKKCVSQMGSALAFEPDLVVHLGEYSRVEASFHNSLFSMSNIIGNISYVLDFCKRADCKLLYAGSSTKYGNSESPYSISKSANTELVKKYCEMFNIEYAITYFYNAYGNGERSSGEYSTVVEKFIQAKINNETVTINGDGSQTRNFTHINDIINGLYLVMKSGVGDGYGIGSDSEYSINNLADFVGVKKQHAKNTSGNRTSAALNTEKTKALGWQPKECIKRYINKRFNTL